MDCRFGSDDDDNNGSHDGIEANDVVITKGDARDGPDAVKSRIYWDNVKPTIDGMLGGFSKISASDISESRSFLSHFFSTRKSSTTTMSAGGDGLSVPATAKLAIDCGAGIGRITKLLLLQFADEVHLLEQSQSFVDKSEQYIGQEISRERVKRICASLQSFDPEPGVMYDIVWLQWVTGYLTDQELRDFLIKMSDCLDPQHGMIFVKDNTTSGNDPDLDMNDSSITRAKGALVSIFESANLIVRKEGRQKKAPRGLYPIYIFALSPLPSHHHSSSRTITASAANGNTC